MPFNKENKITWEELSPSAQELFKNLQTQITNEANARIAADNQLRNDMNTAITNLNNALQNLINTRIKALEDKIDAIFDSQGRLVFPNGDKFWIG